MSQLNTRLLEVKERVLDMMTLVKSQLEHARDASLNFDQDAAQHVIAKEKKVNALDLEIENETEKVLALFSPVASDLRFILSVLKINTFLERIGDNTESLAKYIDKQDNAYLDVDVKKSRLDEAFESAISMVDLVIVAFEEESSKLAAQVLTKDKQVDEINDAVAAVITEMIVAKTERTRQYLYLNSSVRKLERICDLVTNIAEEIIFYVDAKVLRHKKNKVDKFVKKMTKD